MTLNEIWFRILETLFGGLAYAGIAAVFLHIALLKKSLRRSWALLLALVWGSIAAGSLITSWAIYTMHPVRIAWGQGPGCAAKVWLGFTVVTHAPQLVSAWNCIFAVHDATAGRLESAAVVKVRVRHRGWILDRLRLRRGRHGRADDVVG